MARPADPRRARPHRASRTAASCCSFYDGPHLRMVGWRTHHGVYWVTNTLDRAISNSAPAGHHAVAATPLSAARSARSAGRRRCRARIAPNTVRVSGASATSRTTTDGLALGAHEVGQQRHRLAVGHQREQDQQVVGAVPDVGLEAAERPAGADRQLGVVRVPTLPIAHGSSRSAAQRDRAAGAASGWPRGSISRNCSSSSGSTSSRRVRRRAAGTGTRRPATQVEAAQRERGHRLLRLGVGDLDAQRRVLAREPPQRGASRYRPADWIAATRSVPVICSAVGRQVGLGRLQPRQQRVGVARRASARPRSGGRCGRRAPAAARRPRARAARAAGTPPTGCSPAPRRPRRSSRGRRAHAAGGGGGGRAS